MSWRGQSLSLDKFTNSKRILVGTDERLKSDLISIFRDYFGCDVDPLDEGREDFKLVDGMAVSAVCEVKGTNAGVKREHINQVDSHRERNGLAADVPGLLLTNNEMRVESIADRLATAVPHEHVVHARKLNILNY